MMDSKPPQVCRLCLFPGEDAVNIWESFEDSSIASILTKHFWFEVHENDGLTEWLCQMCWIQTKTFHEFYVKVERYHKCLLDSAETDTGGVDETDVANKPSFECLFNLAECKTELKMETIDYPISKVHISGYSDDNSCNQNETSVKIDGETDQSYSLSEKEKQNSQMREWFTMKCELCNDVQFENLSEARRHYRSVHTTEGYLICCGKRYTSLSQILNHISYHQSNPDERSKIEEENDQIRELFTMRCEICSDDVEFGTFLDARRHYRKVHKTMGYLMCCGKKYLYRKHVLEHLLSHINLDAFRCDRCDKSCISKYALKLHIANHVPLDSRAHKCSLCPNTFASESILKHHVKTKHASKTGEKFPCDKCEKSFRSKILLSCHIRQFHEYSLEHVCETCARRFKTKQLLANHVINQHSTTPQPKVQCEICGAWLKREAGLRLHMKSMHQESMSEAIKCAMCNKVAKNKKALGLHMKYVHSERRHQCVLCDKAFRTAVTLKEHMAGHSGEFLYNCPYCEKKFNSKGNMYSHRKNAHLAEWTRDSEQRNALNKNSTHEVESDTRAFGVE